MWVPLDVIACVWLIFPLYWTRSCITYYNLSVWITFLRELRSIFNSCSPTPIALRKVYILDIIGSKAMSSYWSLFGLYYWRRHFLGREVVYIMPNIVRSIAGFVIWSVSVHVMRWAKFVNNIFRVYVVDYPDKRLSWVLYGWPYPLLANFDLRPCVCIAATVSSRKQEILYIGTKSR